MYPNIEAERARNRMRLSDFCMKIGIARTTYYNWQRKGNIPTAKLVVMADMFCCSTDYLLGRTKA